MTVAAAETAEQEVIGFLAERPLVVLTGAGCSTDSGIPDYRGPGSRYAGQQPPLRGSSPPGVMTYQEFVSGPAAQQRYWARSHVGWTRMRHAEPNTGHLALARIDPDLLITQNVDGLHERAGTRRMVALHGRIADVVCLDCREVTPRGRLHDRLDALNPTYGQDRLDLEVRPDGDVVLERTDDFVVAGCEGCGGRLKPDVVFFGENVPKARVERCYAAVDALSHRGGALLVAGSSLAVMSGFRFARRAAKAGIPVVIVNRGATRADDLAAHRVEAGTSEFLAALAATRSAPA
ncbi:Sir2 family NAD-dependent protein deacetylase [Nocardioides sp.]|uniref:Sir2 family NAD-dependent protein deacetylase n=1 Tax=Nocardioides sp. TaxID=35761 RepID=UPI001A29C614|nr:Sir2 family NAD-dependent protein deacetylase [Nocardioides sp.]MBJ7357776.1 NAD-dependent deacetylase [Nocardioides sp.]